MGDDDRDYVGELTRWQVVARTRRGVTVAFMRCDGGEEVDRFTSNEPQLLAFVEKSIDGRST
jgi:hypothetical protein